MPPMTKPCLSLTTSKRPSAFFKAGYSWPALAAVSLPVEISTGRLTAANAGHEYPVLLQPGGQFELYKDKHGFVIGGMDGMRYREYELQLSPGARLFLYTDGVPEANNAENELFGTERMLAALNADTAASPTDMLNNVRRAVDGFVKDAEQFDDLTMLGFEYKGGEQA